MVGKSVGRSVLFALVVVFVVGCAEAEQEFEEPPDGQDDEALAGGKADESFGACHLEYVLIVVNEPGLGVDGLIEEGVHRRAAQNIVDYRTGSDDEIGTEEDEYFESIREVDKVDYVGPVAMQQLVDVVDPYCLERPWRKVEPVFSPSPYTEGFIDRVVSEIDGARRSIDMAAYRLRDNRVMAALGEAVERGVRVRLLFDSANGHHLDMEGSESAKLEEMGVDVRYINRNMHHKFAVIDGPQNELLEAGEARVFSGSANFIFSAVTRYDDNMVFHRGDPVVALLKQREFNHLWEHSRELDWNDELEYFETVEIREEMIPPREHLDILWTSENFETTDSTRWGPGFRPEPFSRVVADELVELIEEADSSIDVAAAFLRLRPISEALIQRWGEEEGPDIRVYLDQSEFISESDHGDQLEELEECLIEAGDDEEHAFDCRQRGLFFSYALVDREIPVRFKTYAYRWHYSYAEQMHQKYMILDEQTVATGSYNYSMNAEQNSMENVVVYRRADYPELVESFVENFDQMWKTGRADERPELLLDAVLTTDEIELVFEPIALGWDEKWALREAIRERCSEVEEEPFVSAPEANRSCEVD